MIDRRIFKDCFVFQGSDNVVECHYESGTVIAKRSQNTGKMNIAAVSTYLPCLINSIIVRFISFLS